MILAIAAALAAAQAPCPEVITAEAFVCRAIRATAENKPQDAAESFEQAALAIDPSNPEVSRLWAAAGNMWIAAGQPGKAALALDKALAGTGLQAEQRGEALLDRARAAEAQNDLKTARAKVNEAAATISQDPFLWYFSAALAIREGDGATAKASIARALSIEPNDPLILFEAGHVAHFTGDLAGAKDYWTRASAADPNGDAGKAAREALALLDDTPAKPPETKP
ncbi:MAG: tetratricopeptide repeat protein [Alphaproteobacteria bacterium]